LAPRRRGPGGHGRPAQDIILDISRLLSRAESPAPTGIDRVELIYAEHLVAWMPERLRYLAVVPPGRSGLLPSPLVEEFLAALSARWSSGAGSESVRRLAWKLRLAALRGGGKPASPGAAYLLLSHHHLDKPDLIAAILRRHRAHLICLMHDLIPLEFPEYARPTEPARHQLRLETVAKFADAIVAVSGTVQASLRRALRKLGNGTAARVHAVPHGATRHNPAPSTGSLAPALGTHPYFVCVGTIEPRKNHLLLLELWRRLEAEMGDATPRLVLIGRRGWENQNILAMLDRCPALRDVVVEREGLPDDELYALLAGARALLFPTFMEGYGLPVAEALAQGVPALCSDIEVLREVGGETPEYLDPIDGLGWRRAVLDYLPEDSPRRAAQLERIRSWTTPSWEESVRGMLAVIDGLPSAVVVNASATTRSAGLGLEQGRAE